MINIFKRNKKEPTNLKEVLDQFTELKNDFNKLSKEFKSLKKDSLSNIQKIGIVRFNPFSEIGGDQSFSLALLDAEDSGVVVTSLYNREGNRVYGKPVKKGLSEHQLSLEEKKAIDKAKNSKTKE